MDNNKEYEKVLNTSNFVMLKKFYEEKSLIDIIGIERKEYVHSNFIYWLLNDKESHKLEDLPLKLFINLCSIKNSKLKVLKKIIEDKNYEIDNIDVKKELGIEKYGRLDIQITFNINNEKFLLIIENKIDSIIGEKQLERYSNWGKKENKNLILVLLAPEELKHIENGFFLITYKELVENIIERCYYNTENTYTKNILENYLKSLSFGINLEKDAIVITEYEKILSKSLYLENENNIIKIINNKNIKKDTLNYSVFLNFLNIVVTQNIVKNEKTRKEIAEFLKLDPIYVFENKSYGKGKYIKLIVAIFKKYEEEIHTYHEFNSTFQSSSSIPNIIREDEIFENENRNKKYFINNNGDLYEDETIKFDNQKYYICHSWNRYEVNEIVKIANDKLNYKIKIQ